MRFSLRLFGCLPFILLGLVSCGPVSHQGYWSGYVYTESTRNRIVLLIEKGDGGRVTAHLNHLSGVNFFKPLPQAAIEGRNFHFERNSPDAGEELRDYGTAVQAGTPKETGDLRLNWSGEKLTGVIQFEGKSYSVSLHRGMEFLIPRAGSSGQAWIQYSYQPPKRLSDGWEVQDLRTVRTEQGRLEYGIREILNQSYKNIHGVVVVKNGKLVLDEYFYGYGPGDEHPLASATKPVLSTLFGIAFDQDLVRPEDKLYDFFPEVRGKPGWNPKKDKITLGMLLSMSSGLACDDWKTSNGCLAEMAKNPDWLSFVLNLPLAQEPGGRFAYANGCLLPLGAILSKQGKLSLPDFAQKVLYDPLGIQARRWYTTPGGTTEVFGSHWLRPRDLAKLGVLYLNKGLWNGKKVLSENWVGLATSRQISVPAAYTKSPWDFGYLWILENLSLHGKNVKAFSAQGSGGQYIWVVPELNLVGVVSCGKNPNELEKPAQRELFEQYIMNALY